ncbi:inositol-tetrakisphosphate 1-kinase-like isoform X1 [Lampetra fluviatilis]
MGKMQGLAPSGVAVSTALDHHQQQQQLQQQQQQQPVVGYWLSDKKRKKLNFHVFAELCRSHGIQLVKIDLQRDLDQQGPFRVILHKLTDLLLEADQGNATSTNLVQRFQSYVDSHPETMLLDPLHAVRKLLDRCRSYDLIQELEICRLERAISTPAFVRLNTSDPEEMLALMRERNVTFPFVCKNIVAHGSASHEWCRGTVSALTAAGTESPAVASDDGSRNSSYIHEMAIVFGEAGLRDIRPPCVAQSFINHDGVLHKVFVIGDTFHVVERPSLKNFPAGKSDQKTIFFNSHDVSKAESASHLNARDESQTAEQRKQLSLQVVRRLVEGLRETLEMSLFGIDIIVDRESGHHAVIDINAFPGYDGVADFFPALLMHVQGLLQAHKPSDGVLTNQRLQTPNGQLEPPTTGELIQHHQAQPQQLQQQQQQQAAACRDQDSASAAGLSALQLPRLSLPSRPHGRCGCTASRSSWPVENGVGSGASHLVPTKRRVHSVSVSPAAAADIGMVCHRVSLVGKGSNGR